MVITTCFTANLDITQHTIFSELTFASMENFLAGKAAGGEKNLSGEEGKRVNNSFFRPFL